MPRWIAITQLVIGVALVHGEALGQTAPECAVPTSDRTVVGAVRGTLRPIGHHSPPAEYTAAVLDAIGAQYPTNSPVGLAVYRPYYAGAVATAYVALEFTATKSGAVEDVKVLATSLSSSFDQNALAAVAAAGVNGLPPIPKGSGSHLQFELDVDAATEPDVVHARDTVRAVRAQWVGITMPVWLQAVAASTVPGNKYFPAYPEVARQRAIGDSVLVQFVIGADGRVAPGTAILLHARYREFVQSVSDELGRALFRPEAIGACPVATLVTEPFAFVIRRP